MMHPSNFWSSRLKLNVTTQRLEYEKNQIYTQRMAFLNNLLKSAISVMSNSTLMHKVTLPMSIL